MPPPFRLFWLRETGCDAGTLLRADELEPEIRETVLALAQDGEETILRLPFLDKKEWPQRGELLAGLSWERHGNEIRAALPPQAALRDMAARLALTDPAWANVPKVGDPDFFRVWQSVSLALQKSLRAWIAEAYFRDVARFDDRASAQPMLAYQTARWFYGRRRGEFTYDLRDYPHCQLTLALALKMTGRTLQASLAHVEERLNDAGNPALARRYAPRWYQDILREVRRKPQRFIELLAAERKLINAVIDLGGNRTAAGVNHFAKAAGQSLRNVCGMDLRALGLPALREATDVLAKEVLRAERDGMVENNPHEFARTSEGLRPRMEQTARPDRLVA